MAHRFRQFRLLVWKNFLLQVRTISPNLFSGSLSGPILDAVLSSKEYLLFLSVLFLKWAVAFNIRTPIRPVGELVFSERIPRIN